MNTSGKATLGLLITYATFTGVLYLAFGPISFFVSAVFMLGVNIYAYFFYEQKLIKKFNLELLPKQNPHNLNLALAEFSQKAKITEPKIYLCNQPYDQAFSFGSNYKKQNLVIYTQLLNKLNINERRVLMALLIAQIKNKNSISHTISSFFVSGLYFITQSLDEILRFLTGIKQAPNNKRANLFTYLNSPLIFLYLCLFNLPNELYKADKMASIWLDNKQKVTRLLLKLEIYSLKQIKHPPINFSHLFLTSPLTPFKWTRYLVWQPNVKKRTLKLVGHYPA